MIQDALVAFYRGVADFYCDKASPFEEGELWAQYWQLGYTAVQEQCSVKDIIAKAMSICEEIKAS